MLSAQELIDFWVSRTWNLHRQIADQKLGLKSFFSGQCTVIAQDVFWIYKEQGVLFYDKKSYLARRSLLYEIRNNQILVCFEDQRPFHTINFANGPVLKFQHHCGQDRYSGNLIVEAEQWKNVWQVQGPNKDLEIVTLYS